MQKALDKLPEVLKEVSRVREDLGFPPLVTPTSQIVGTQAVMNVISGERYKIVPNEVKDYVKGLYGRSPAPIDPSITKKILGDETPINYRPADRLNPMLPKATDGVDPSFIHGEEDILSYVLLPEPALEYFKWNALPVDKRPEIPADTELKKVMKWEKAADEPVKKEAAPAKVISAAAQQLHIEGVAGELLEKIGGLAVEEIVFRKGDYNILVKPAGAYHAAAPAHAAFDMSVVTSGASAAPSAAAPAESPAESKPEKKEEYSKTINAPLVGTFYSAPGPGKPTFVKEGDVIEAGAKVCIVEAMKLFNEISAPVRCRVVKVLIQDGTAVDKDQPLIGIEEI
jgi:oxaloacetate decarboxylase alpha subunit